MALKILLKNKLVDSVPPLLNNLFAPNLQKFLIDENTIAVVAPHYAGLMCDIKAIESICKEKSIFLVEDACHAPTAYRNGIVSGSTGDASTFSFLLSRNC